MTNVDTTLIGRLLDVSENQMRAAVERKGGGMGFPVIELDGDRLAVGQIGTYVIIRQEGFQVVAMVLSAGQYETSPDRLPGTEKGGSGYCGVMNLVPLGEMDAQLNFQRGIVHYPIPGAEVHLARKGEVDALFSRHRALGYELGYLPSRPSITLSLDPSSLFGRHLAILGQSGSGKSWGVASLLQRAVGAMPNAHIILLDLHGEYAWTNEEGERQAAFDESIYRYVDARDLEIPYWLLSYAELVDLLIDRSDKHASTQMAFLRETLLILRRTANKEMEEVKISIDSPVYFPLVEMYHQFKHANEQMTDFGKVKGPLYGQFDEFLIKMQARFNDVRYDFLFKPKRRRTSASLSDLLRDFVGLQDPRRQITVVDFSTVPFDIRPTLSAQVGRLAFEFNYWNPHAREFPILLVCEEAHAYIPRSTGTQYEGTRRSMERIAKEGRKYGVGLAVVSQRPHELSETVLAQCGNFICLRVTNPDDQQYIRDLVPDAESGLVNILSSLGRGEAMAMGEAVSLPTRFQFYLPNPPPNSSDVDFYNQWKKVPEKFDVEMIADRWRRQGQ